MAVTPEEFVDRLLTEDGGLGPCDDCKVSEVEISLPPWYDEKLFKAGTKFYWDNFYAMVGGQTLGLVTIIAVPSTLDVLVSTKKSSSTWTSYRRYASTAMHVNSWFAHELRPGSKSWKSLSAVRRRHLKASNTAQSRGVGLVSQRDIALTQWGFVGYLLLFPDKLGVEAFDRNSWEGFNHVWATLCYMLGLENRYNLCLRDVEETRKVCRILLDRVFCPLLTNPPEPYEHMARVIVDSLWSLLPILEPKGLIYIARMLAGVPGYVYTQQELIDFRNMIKKGEVKEPVATVKEWQRPHSRLVFNADDFYRLSDVPQYQRLFLLDRVKFHTLMFLNHLYQTRVGRFVLNYLIIFLFFLAEHFPVLAFVRFGISGSFVNIFEEDVPDNTKPMSNAEVLRMYSEPPWYYRLERIISFLR